MNFRRSEGMKAVVWERYGDSRGLKFKEVDKPVAKIDEVLIKIQATTVSTGDTEMRGLKFSLLLKTMIRLYMGILKPRNKILGQELVGRIETVGEQVKTYKVGDQVVATTGFKFGGYAEYICLKPSSDMVTMTLKPEFLSVYEAAALPVAGMEVYHYLELANLKKGDHILINGAAGSFGTFATQLAKFYGAEVTGVDTVEKFEVLNLTGADHCIDYRGDSFYNNKEQYDVIFDIVGKTQFKKSLKCLKADGRYIFATPRFKYKLQHRLIKPSNKRVIFELSKPNNIMLNIAVQLVKEVPIKIYVDRVMSLEEVPKAHDFIEKGLKKGNLVIHVSDDSE